MAIRSTAFNTFALFSKQSCNFVTVRNTFCTGTFQDSKLSKYSYWKNRYKETANTSFEWFLNSKDAVEPILNNIHEIPGTSSCPLLYLDVGCGLSDLTPDLVSQSSRPLCAVMVDFVSEALLHQRRHQSPGLGLVCADVKSLPLREAVLDVVLDKGTMDALIKDKVQGRVNSCMMLQEVTRVLAPGGRYLQISDEDPDSRQLFLESLSQQPQASAGAGDMQASKDFHISPWKFETITTQLGSEYFLYWTEKL